MSEPSSPNVSCPVVVLRIEQEQVMGDTLADALREEMTTIYRQTRAVHVVIDFSHVKYLASSGFRPLLTLIREVRQRGGRMLLCGLTEDVQDVFSITRLVSSAGSAPATFEAYPDVPTAVAALYRANAGG